MFKLFSSVTKLVSKMVSFTTQRNLNASDLSSKFKTYGGITKIGFVWWFNGKSVSGKKKMWKIKGCLNCKKKN